MYYMCVRYAAAGGGYTYVHHHMPCGPGTVWDQSILVCNVDTNGECDSSSVVDSGAESESGMTLQYILLYETRQSHYMKKATSTLYDRLLP